MMEEEDQGPVQDEEEEEEEEEDSEEDEDDDDDEGDEEGHRRTPKSTRGQPSTPTKRNRRRAPKTAEETTHLNAPSFVTSSSGDAYLLASSMTSRTSDNLLSAHFDEPFTHDSYLSVLHASGTAPAMDAYHASLQATLDKLSLRCFATWVWYMKQGFNYLVHGVGSKIPLLNRFAEEVSTRCGPVVVVNGYDPSTTLQDVLTALEEIVKEAIRQDLLEAIPKTRSGHKPSAKSLSPTKGKGKANAMTNDSSDTTFVISGSTSAIEARAQRFVHSLASAPSALPDIYLVVHSLDAPSLRASKSLSILALLASQPRLHFVASVDHVRSGLLFPTALAATRPPPNLKRHQANLDIRSFTFLYQQASTRQPYTTEVLHNGTLSRLFPSTIFPPLSSTLDPSTSSLVQSTRHVLASVTDRAKSIFNLLACQQLELMRARKGEDKVGVAGGGGGGGGGRAPGCAILLDKFKELATDRLLAAHNDQVDGLLAEFRDHNVVRGSMNRPKRVVEEGEDDQEDEEEEDGDEGEWVWIALGREALENVWEELGME
ncbi:BZ3500_MvSof-1268-A1-R1_Chr1-3g02207 [Microbotryum saponariae]|uniref:Origin recognition complex subunit 2 n=1 Tax=Microbotryum saponariae TaxID=289078 RepID=A0A2X0MFP1_9BASI|nr:BZ3500_MvSof-1268-A1-R1_Chr1-3g02207 [Microbotryum saponariae]SCZ95654.1 BZ3501_MvSof-1269-A2-R1_Chr1-3g01810 [Microbotryum saponariae]